MFSFNKLFDLLSAQDKSVLDTTSKPKKQTCKETFILESILSPSGLIDTGDESPDPVIIDHDLPDEIEIEVDLEDETASSEDLTPVEVSNSNEVDEVEIPFITDIEELDIEDNSETSEDNLAESNKETITEAETTSELSEDSETERTQLESNTEFSIDEDIENDLESSPEIEASSIENQNETVSVSKENTENSTVKESSTAETVSEAESNLELPEDSQTKIAESTLQEESELEEIDTTAEDSLNESNEEVEVSSHSDTEESNYTDTINQNETEANSNNETDIVEEIASSAIDFNFDSGIFTVGETGELQVDYLFDGGGFGQGEVAIFSLEGMEELDLSLEEFIQEAASRALSDSELGYIVISDADEGARFSGGMGSERDFNKGDYLGLKTFKMNPGDEFAVMLVPNGKVQQVFDNPSIEGSTRPLFSLSTTNPEDGFQLGQIADVTGDGNTFAFEDLRIDNKSDRDYNDIIFQVRGATGKAIDLDEVISNHKDWRSDDMGQALIEYAKPYVTPEEPIVEIENGLSDLLTELEDLLDKEDSETEIEGDVEGSNSETIDTEATDEIVEVSEAEESQNEVIELVESTESEIDEAVVIENEDNLETPVVEESETEIEDNAENSVVDESKVIENEDSLETPVVKKIEPELKEIEAEDNSPTTVIEKTEELEVVESEDNSQNPIVEKIEESEVIKIEESGETSIVQQDEELKVSEVEENLNSSTIEETEELVVNETKDDSDSSTSTTEAIVVDDSSDNLNIEETKESEVIENTDNSQTSVVEEAEELEAIVTEESLVTLDTTENESHSESSIIVESEVELQETESQAASLTSSVEEYEQSETIEIEDDSKSNIEENEETELADANNLSENSALSVETTEALPVETVEIEEVVDNLSETPPTSTVNSPTVNLVERLENLTYNLQNQTLSETPVNSNLLQQLEQLTNRLISNGETSLNSDIPSQTLALIEQLETQLVTPQALPIPIEAPIDFEFPTENQPLIGVIDTGFSGDNPDIDYSRITWGQDHVDGDSDPTLTAGEGNEHGTHILGLIAAEQDNGIGIDGINDNAPIWAGRAIGSGKWAESLVEFVDAAVESGQPNAVVNLSLDLTQIDAEGNVTTRYEFTPIERAAIEYARQNNVMIVVGAGNDGGVMSALGQASQEFDNIITVGAAERVNDAIANSKAFERASYSSYGQGLDVIAAGGTTELPELSTSGDGVGTMAGTSVATAKVTGAISQVWAANPELSYRQVIEIVKDTATDLGVSGWDTETGAGLLNIAAAVQLGKITTPEEHITPPILNIETWSGEGVFTAGDRAVNNNPPTVTVHNRDAKPNEVIPAANFFSATPEDGNPITKYKFYSSDLMPGSGYFTLNGVKTSHSFTINADQLKDLQFVSSSVSEKIQTFSIRAFNGKAWSSEVNAVVNPQTINGTAQNNKPPKIITKNRDFKPGETVALSTLFSVNDADAMQIYHIYDRDHDNNSGYITLNGVKQSGSIYVNASQLKDLQFVASGQTGKTETFSIRGFDGKHWSQYGNFVANPQPVTGSVATNRVPIVSTNNVTLAPNSTIAASSLFSVQDPDGDPMQVYYFHNRDSSSDGSYFTLNGVKQPRTVYVNANQLEDLRFVAGRDGVQPQSIAIAAFDGKHWSDDSVLSVNSGQQTTQQNSVAGVPGKSRQYIVKSGDTLWSIAQRQLGNGNRWREIMKTPTGGTFTDAEAKKLRVGQSVYLPVSYQTGTGHPVISPPSSEPKLSYLNQQQGFDIDALLASVPSNIRPYAKTSIPLILAEARAAGITDLGQIAYILATSQHESFSGKWMEELASGNAYEGRTDLGNHQPGDGRRFKGRGYVQITGRTNYTNWSRKLGINLVSQPQRASEPAIAAKIITQGMRDGSFTGVGLSRYINGSKRDFFNARRIVNGTDKAASISEIAERYYAALLNSKLTSTPPSNNPRNFHPESFTGSVGSSIGVALRNSPKHSDKSGLAEPHKKTLHFDGWMYGESVKDIWTGKADALWYRYWKNGKAYWVPSAYIYGYPKSKPPIQPNASKPKPTAHTLKPGATNLEFRRGQKWVTSTGYKFVFQTDGNLVLYTPQGKVIWATGTDGTKADRLSVQTDGNVVLYAGRGNPVWATNTAGNPGASFAIQTDGNLVVYSSNRKPLFSSNTVNGRKRTLTASRNWLRDRNLKRFPGLKFSTVVSKATGKALDGGGGNNSVYPYPSPNPGNAYHQWGFEKVGNYYMIINKATGKALDGGGAGGKLPYVHPDPQKNNSYQLWKLQKVGNYYMIINKATGRALDSGGASGNQIYMYPKPIAGNSFHQWKLNLPNSGSSSTDFTGKVMSHVSQLNVRSGPGTGYSKVGSYRSNTSLTFDAWTRGTSHWDQIAKQWDNRWFRIKGTNKWVASAYIYGNPKSSSKYINSPGNPNPGNGGGSYYSNIKDSINQYFSTIPGWSNKSLKEKWDRIGGDSSQYGTGLTQVHYI